MGDQIILLFMQVFFSLLFKTLIFWYLKQQIIGSGGKARAAEGSLGKIAPMKFDLEGEEGKVEAPFEVDNAWRCS